MAYDPATGQVVLFGGCCTIGGYDSDTWTWDGSNWTQAFPATSPGPLFGASMAYDQETGQLLLFGGAGNGGLDASGKTWTWDGSNWTQLFPATSPLGRWLGSMAYDRGTGQLIVFGGQDQKNAILDDTWSWNGTTWTQLFPATTPPARAEASMDDDPGAARVVLFGGGKGSTVFDDTWTWDGTTWTRQSPVTSPPFRVGASMAYDPDTGQLVLFGGNANDTALDDTWTWDGTTWTRSVQSTSPPARTLASMATGPGTGQLLVFGGATTMGASLSDTWTYGSAPRTTPTITWATPAPITQGTPLSGVQLDATASVPGSFAYLPPAGTVLSAGTQTLTVTFTPTDTNDYTVASASVPLVVDSPPQHGFWLVGGDGGIFTFGSAQFYGSTGSFRLQRPVVGIAPTPEDGGYWLVASDGGTFAFGGAGFYGSVPGLGFSPAGTLHSPHPLNAPIVGMVPSTDGRGYFMVAADGGVFAFGDARFAGSCPGIGGCVGTAVAVMPDATGDGYWLVTTGGAIYAFGDADYYGAPGQRGVPVTSAARTPDGRGYWILFADGAVFSYGDAKSLGSLPGGVVGGFNPATAIFSTGDGEGYWIASAAGDVYPFGDAPNDGNIAALALNAPIIAAVGW